LEGRVRELFPAETAEILPYLASLLAIEVTDEYAERVKYLDGEALGRQVYRAARRFFQRLAEKLPLVLVFDDLHWMDASSAGLVEHLLPLVERVPVLLIGLSRPDPETPAARLRDVAETGYGERFTVVSLPPLSADDSGRLVQNLLTIDDLPDHVRRMMIDRADGNPYYLEEIVRDLIEAGVIVQEASTGRWRATRSIEKVTVPETIQGLLLARIDRLDDELKRVVRRAAVVGRSFLYRVLSKVLDDDRDLDEHLARLQNVELILEKQRLPELEYIFKHALAQEAAYDSILIQERRRMHGRVGTAIETLMAERLEEFYGLLAYHYSAAEDWERAQEYLFKAGDQAGRMAADAEALAHYQQAIEAYARVRGDDWEPLERAQLERKIGEALFRLGEHNQARAYLVRALSLLGEAPPATHWGTRLGLLRATLRQAAHRLLPRLFVRPMTGAPDDRLKEVLQAGEALGWLEALVDTERFLLNNLTMLNLCERGGFARQGAHFASTVGITADAVGRLGYAETYYDLSAEYSQHISPYRPTPLLETGLAAHYYRLGHFEKSVEISLHCAEIAQSMGDLRQWGAGIIWSAWSNFALGRFEQARRTCEHMIDVAEEGSDRQVLCWGLGALGACLRRVGLVDQAIASLVRAIVLSEQLPDYTSRVTMSGYLGRCYLNSGDLKKALSELETGASIMSVHGDLYGASTSLGIGLAEAHLTAAESAAGNVQREWMGKANLATRGLLKSAEYTRMAMPEAMMFKGRFEWLRGKLGAAEEWWRRALKEANETGARCGEGVIHLEIGRRLGDRDHLLRAESILEEVGARLDLELAREARAEIDNG
jgi:tetratricopeptide (TPR) repeat protein